MALSYRPLRCCPDDAGEYKVVAKSPLGEATTFGTLVVNCEWFHLSKTHENKDQFLERSGLLTETLTRWFCYIKEKSSRAQDNTLYD